MLLEDVLDSRWSPLSAPFDWSSDVNYGQLSNFIIDSEVRIDQALLESLRKSVHNHGFDQWGATFGSVIQDDSSEEEVYYRGLRQRFSKPNVESFQLERKIVITGITDHGFHFTINQHFIKNHAAM